MVVVGERALRIESPSAPGAASALEAAERIVGAVTECRARRARRLRTNRRRCLRRLRSPAPNRRRCAPSTGSTCGPPTRRPLSARDGGRTGRCCGRTRSGTSRRTRPPSWGPPPPRRSRSAARRALGCAAPDLPAGPDRGPSSRGAPPAPPPSPGGACRRSRARSSPPPQGVSGLRSATDRRRPDRDRWPCPPLARSACPRPPPCRR